MQAAINPGLIPICLIKITFISVIWVQCHFCLNILHHFIILQSKTIKTYNDIVQIGDKDVRQCLLHDFLLRHALKTIDFPLDFLEGFIDLLLSFNRRGLLILLSFLGFGSGFGFGFRFTFGFGFFACRPSSLSFSRCLKKKKHFDSLKSYMRVRIQFAKLNSTIGKLPFCAAAAWWAASSGCTGICCMTPSSLGPSIIKPALPLAM